MRFRRLMAASMAGVMAVSSAVVCQITASAAFTFDMSNLGNGWNSEYNASTKTITYSDGWSGRGWDCAKADFSDYDQIVLNYSNSTVGMVKLVVEYCDASGNKTGSSDNSSTATEGTIKVNLDPEKKSSVLQVYIQNENIGSVTIDSIEAAVDTDTRTPLSIAFDTNPIVLTVVEASWDTQTGKAAQNNVVVELPLGLEYGVTTYGDFKAAYKSIVISDIGYESDTAGVGAANISVTPFAQWNNDSIWTSGNGSSMANDSVSWQTDEITYRDSAVTPLPDTAVLSKLGFQLNINGSNLGDLEIGDTLTVNPATYDITVSSAITNGKVTADPRTAAADEKVTLTVTPDKGYKLKADSLKVTKKGDPATTVAVTDNKFVMRDYDVEVSAEFEKIAVESVSVKAATSITVGGTETLVAKVTPDDAFDASVKWKSSDTAVATVDENGKVTAVKAGTADITATTSNGKTATCTVTVTDKVVAATAVTVDPTTAELEVGSTVTITGKVTPDDSTDKITWKSSDTAVATVDETGKVTAVKAGTADITATTSNGKTATCTVTVKAAPEKLEGAFEYAYDGSPIELTVGEATWSDSGLAAQKNASLEMKGVTFKTTTFGELKKLYSGIVINNLEIKNVPEGIKADEISVCIYIKSGSGWSWNSFNGTSVNFADITKISDSDAIMEVGYQLNYNIPAGTSYKTGDTITINAKKEVVDPNAEIISPSTKVQQVDVKTDKNGNVTEQIAYFAISEKDAKTCESYIVTIGRGKDNKKLVREIKNCFKTVQYKAADGSDKTVVAADGAYCVLLDITNIGSDYGTLTIKIEPKK